MTSNNDNIHHILEETVKVVASTSKNKVILESSIRGSLKAMLTIGRLSVLKEFDELCKADAFIGFTDTEWAAVKKFFEMNKIISGWDKADENENSTRTS